MIRTAHCPHILTFLTNLRVSMVHEHALTFSTTLTTANFLPKSTKCVSNVMLCTDRQLLTKDFLFLPRNKMLASQTGQSKIPVPAESISLFCNSVFVTTSKILLFQHCFMKGQTSYISHYLLTPWNRVLLEKLTVSQLVKKFPKFYGTRRLIAAFTNFRYVSQS